MRSRYGVLRMVRQSVVTLLVVLAVPLCAQQHIENAAMAPPNQGLQLEQGKWIELPDNPTIVLDTFTVECWLKASTRTVIVSRDRPGNAQPDWSVVYEESNQRIEFMTGMNSQPDSYFWTPVGSFPKGTWTHLALTVNGPAGRANCYINGSLKSTFTFAPRSFTVQTGLAWGGYYGNQLGATGGGWIDECRYWSTERTQAQISSLMATRIFTYSMYPELRGFWRFCGNYNDDTQYGNHMIPRNSPPIVYINDLPMGIDCEQIDFELWASPARPICKGDSIQLFAQAVGGRQPYQYAWSPIQYIVHPYVQDPVVFPPRTMMFVVMASDADGKQAIDSVLVEVLPELIIDAGPDLHFCKPGEYSLHCAVISGAPPLRFSWEAHPTMEPLQQNIQSPRINVPGPGRYRYYVRVEDAAGCWAMDSVDVEIEEGLEVDLGRDRVACFDTDVRLDVTVSGGTAPYTYEWSPDSVLDSGTGDFVIVRSSGSTWVRVRVTDSNGCTGEDSVNVAVYPRLEARIDGPSRLCVPGEVVLTATTHGGTPPYKWEWEPVERCTTPDAASTRVRVDSTMVVTCRITDINGCTIELVHRIQVFPGLYLRVPRELAVCRGDDVWLEAVASGTPPLEVRWTPEQYVHDPQALRTRADVDSIRTFHVTVRDADGCEAVDSIRVLISDGPIVDAGYDLVLCHGDSVRLQPLVRAGVKPYRYRWSPSRGLLDPSDTRNPLIRAEDDIVYYLEVVDAAGCVATDSVTVTVNAGAEVAILPVGPITLCEGDSVVLEATPGFARYEWFRNGIPLPQTGAQMMVSQTGLYHVRVSTAGGCPGESATLLVRVLPVPQPVIVAAPPHPVCEGDTVILRTTQSYAAYEWRDALGTLLSTDSMIVRVTEGPVTVTVSSASPCPGTSEPYTALFVSPVPTGPIGPVSVCEGDQAVYFVPMQAGDSCVWVVEGGTVVSTEPAGTLTVSWTKAGSGRVLLRIWKAHPALTVRCYGEQEYPVLIHDRPEPSLSVSGDTVLCAGDARVLRTEPGAAGYLWSTPGGSIIGSDTLLVWQAGTYTVRVTDVNGCEGTSPPVRLEVLPVPIVDIDGDSVLCAGEASMYLASTGSATRVRWNAEEAVIEGGVDGDTLRLRWDLGGTYVIRVLADDGICTAEDSLVVRVVESPRPRITPEGLHSICAGDSILLDAGSGYSMYEWSTPTGLFHGQQVQACVPGQYSVRVVNAFGCEGSSEPVTVMVRQPDIPVITGPDGFCPGDSIVLAASPGFMAYAWSNGDRTSSTVIHTAGSFFVRVIDSAGCTAVSALHDVRVYPGAAPPVITQRFDSLHCTEAVAYTWYLDGTELAGVNTRSIPIPRPGNYRVVIKNEYGCPSMSDIYLVDRLLDASTVVGLPELEAEPGEIIHIPLRILHEANLAAFSSLRYNAEIAFDESLLVPVGATPPGSVVDGKRRIPFVNEHFGGADPIAVLSFMVTLGTASETPLTFVHFDWNGSPIRVQTRDGKLRVKVCREGGERLFDGSNRLFLEQNAPNPAVAHTTIRFSVLTEGTVQLVLMDAFGRSIRTLLDRSLPPGAHQVAVSLQGLASGMYRYELRTAAGTRQRLMIVTR